MTMILNGAELEEVRFNGVDCEKVYFNGALVFEKAVGNQYLLTVGRYDHGNGHIDLGYMSDFFGEPDGSLEPKYVDSIEIEPTSIMWTDWPVFMYVTVFVEGLEDFRGLWKLTIGSWEGLLWGDQYGVLEWNSQDYRPEIGRLFTKADFDAIPKTGTHQITIEKVS